MPSRILLVDDEPSIRSLVSLAPDDATRVFERFYRVDAHLSEGTGVGLPGLGAGSTFVLPIPSRSP